MQQEVKQDRPSYVRFETRPVEGKDAKGMPTFIDRDFALVTPIGSKDVVVRVVSDWFTQLDQQVREERIPAEWVAKYKQAYELWKKGQDIPPEGTPIRGWPAISPAQQENVIRANILTVEDLAQATDEPIRRIGLGALDLREKARAWLKAQSGPAKLASEMASLKMQLEALAKRNDELEAANKNLQAEVKALQPAEATQGA